MKLTTLKLNVATILTLTLLVLVLAMAGCTKTQAKPTMIVPLTGDEKFMILSGPGLVNKFRQVANETTEAATARVARATFEQTKEFKAAKAAQETANKLAQVALATKVAKAMETAQALAKKTQAMKAADKAEEDWLKSVDAVYQRRGLTQKDHIICAGPATETGTGQALGDTCTGVPDGDYQFRVILQASEKKEGQK